MPSGLLLPVGGQLRLGGRGNSVITPAGVIRPILLPLSSVNQRLPSGPAVMLVGPPREVRAGREGKIVNTPVGVTVWAAMRDTSVTNSLPSGGAPVPRGGS